MAKPTFSKLKLQLNKNVVPIQIGEQAIAVKQYLPIEEKLELISKIIMQAHEPESNYNNPLKTDALIVLELIFAYTDLVFTDKQKEDLPKLYDLLHCNNIDTMVIDAIGENEYNEIKAGVYRSIDAIYSYQNSVLGIVDQLNKKKEIESLKLDEALEAIKDPEAMTFLKGVLDNLS